MLAVSSVQGKVSSPAYTQEFAQMAFRDYALRVLEGGLPAVIDYGTGGAAPAAQGDVANAPKGRVEQTPPEPTKKDSEPFLQQRIRVTENFDINVAAALVATVAIAGVIIALFVRR